MDSCRSVWKIVEKVSKPRICRECSTPSSAARPTALASAWPSAVRLSKIMAAGCGSNLIRPAGGHSISRCPGPELDMPSTMVSVVDDDDNVRESLAALLGSLELEVECYSCPRQFLDSYSPERPGCIVLDLRMPQLTGLDVIEELSR